MSHKMAILDYLFEVRAMVVENAFGRLKGRWRRLLKGMTCHWNGCLPFLLLVVLHNICEVFKKSFDERWTTEDNNDRPQPNTSAEDEVDSIRPVTIHIALMKYFEEH